MEISEVYGCETTVYGLTVTRARGLSSPSTHLVSRLQLAGMSDLCWEDRGACLPDDVLPPSAVLYTAFGSPCCHFWFRLDLVPSFFIYSSSFDCHLAIFNSLSYKHWCLFKRKPAALGGRVLYLPCALADSGPQATLISIRGFKGTSVGLWPWQGLKVTT